MGWECGLVIELLSSMYEALGSITSTAKKFRKKLKGVGRTHSQPSVQVGLQEQP